MRAARLDCERVQRMCKFHPAARHPRMRRRQHKRCVRVHEIGRLRHRHAIAVTPPASIAARALARLSARRFSISSKSIRLRAIFSPSHPAYSRPDFSARANEMRLAPIVFAFCLALAAVPAAAQPDQAPPPPAPQRGGPDWYQAQLTELSTVLGGAHYLRILCQGRGDQRWRDYMKGVIDREPAQRNNLVAGFNAGFREQEARYDHCDTYASQTEAELRARGLRIANGLSARR